MVLEIEKRFLIKNKNWKNYIINHSSLEQGYFNSDSDGWIIRVRSENEQYKLTFKKHLYDSTSQEFEYEIPSSEGKIILSNLKNKVRKDRFYLKINQQDWIIDIFKDKNFPLEIAEIEVPSLKNKIELPSFLSKEITGMKKFSNFSLSKKPFGEWSEEDLKKNY